MVSPPSASITATSTATRPGSCTGRRYRNPAKASPNPLVSPVTSAISGQQTGTGMTDYTPTTTRDCNLRTRAGTLHLESAFRDGRSGP